jgi:hypothetical protein
VHAPDRAHAAAGSRIRARGKAHPDSPDRSNSTTAHIHRISGRVHRRLLGHLGPHHRAWNARDTSSGQAAVPSDFTRQVLDRPALTRRWHWLLGNTSHRRRVGEPRLLSHANARVHQLSLGRFILRRWGPYDPTAHTS